MATPTFRRAVSSRSRLSGICFRFGARRSPVGYGSVAAFARSLPEPPQVVNLEPASLADILDDISRVAAALGVAERGEVVVSALERRVEQVRARAGKTSDRPRCFLMEWIDPPFCSGHWGPELVEIAGGEEILGKKGASRRILWESGCEAQPEVLIIACCGCTVARTLDDLPRLQRAGGWEELPAVRSGWVYVVDGSAYFSRPGPRIVDSLEILGACLHPAQFPEMRARYPDAVVRTSPRVER